MFKSVKVLCDLIYLTNTLFMYDFYSNRLLTTFVHAVTKYIDTEPDSPEVRTDYGKFNIRFNDAKL